MHLGFISFVLVKDRQMPLVWDTSYEQQAVLHLQPGCDVFITKQMCTNYTFQVQMLQQKY